MKLRNIVSALVLGLLVGQNMVGAGKLTFTNKTRSTIHVNIERRVCSDVSGDVQPNENVTLDTGVCAAKSVSVGEHSGKNTRIFNLGTPAAGKYTIEKDPNYTNRTMYTVKKEGKILKVSK